MINKKIFELKLREDLENRWLCVGYRPAYEYVDGEKTDKVIGVTYTCLHAQVLASGTYDIKVLGQKPVMRQEDIAETGYALTFEHLVFTEWTDKRTGARRTSGRADSAEKA